MSLKDIEQRINVQWHSAMAQRNGTAQWHSRCAMNAPWLRMQQLNY
jgi:hypothetical protein